uniref:Novel immune-type receptor 3d, allele 1 n=1 Tax=Danio rerio TaxID=7955 RepID=Q8AW68_DANRE|nr:novel immune-type receptor 3d, allele 1 [Danio rerio]CAE17646.1 novel immune-type receptor 3d, allele 1 [Danio rerio]|eukprot:NP_938168.1 novel immune-type receptor 3d isoform 2 precursor [Danio rerio]
MSLQSCFTFFLFTFAYGTCEEDFIHQQPLVVAELGSSVTLPCFHSDDFITTISWYKHSAGKKPLLIAHSAPNSGRVTYQNTFNNTNRFFITIASGSYNLSILHLEKEDFATYYCAKFFLNIMMFGEGTILLHNETNIIITPKSSFWSPVVLILSVISAISIIVNIFLMICTYCKEDASEQILSRVIQVDTNYFNYVALQSSSVTTSQEETICVYTQTSKHFMR